ncbi:MAG TPA: hypothetical protein VMG12_09765, partial [Polyangiaceae bacterium]|nr:hypothetical protein [Polyangiaceae bacterium]
FNVVPWVSGLLGGLKRSRGWGLALGVLGAGVLAPGKARAGVEECDTNAFIAPERGAANVPTDTLLWGYDARVTRLVGPSGGVVSDTASGRFGVLDLAGNFSGWVSVPLELPSLAEVDAAVAEEHLAGEAEGNVQSSLNVQQGRPPACSLRAVGGLPAKAREPRRDWSRWRSGSCCISPGGLVASRCSGASSLQCRKVFTPSTSR